MFELNSGQHFITQQMLKKIKLKLEIMNQFARIVNFENLRLAIETSCCPLFSHKVHISLMYTNVVFPFPFSFEEFAKLLLLKTSLAAGLGKLVELYCIVLY